VFNVAKNHLFDDKLAVLIVGKKEVKDSLSSYGNINVIDITIPEPPEKEIIPEPTPESMKEGTALLTGAAQKMGAKQLSALQNYSFEGTMAIKSEMGEFSMNQKGVIVFPDKVYLDIQTPMGKMEQVIKGNEGYMAMGDKKRPLPESQLREAKKSLYTSLCGVNLLKDVLAKKLEGQYIGEKELNSNKVKLVVVRIDGQPVKIYISGDGLICAISSKQNTQEGPKELLEVFSDFRDVKGLKLPFTSKTMDKDKEVESSVNSKIDINIDIPENVEAILGIK
jgi:zinc protease